MESPSVFKVENDYTLVISYKDQIYVCEKYNQSEILIMSAIRCIFNSRDDAYLKEGWQSNPWRYINYYWKTKLENFAEIGGLLILNFKSVAQNPVDGHEVENYADIESRIEFKLDIVRTLEYLRIKMAELKKQVETLRHAQNTVQQTQQQTTCAALETPKKRKYTPRKRLTRLRISNDDEYIE